MRLSTPSVAARIKALITRIEAESDPAAPSLVVPADDTAIDDGGRYGDPLRVERPAFLQQLYDEMAAEELYPTGDWTP